MIYKIGISFDESKYNFIEAMKAALKEIEHEFPGSPGEGRCSDSSTDLRWHYKCDGLK